MIKDFEFTGNRSIITCLFIVGIAGGALKIVYNGLWQKAAEQNAVSRFASDRSGD
jgi:hypothetical protein